MKKISNYFKQLTHKSFLAPFLIFGILLNLILFFIMQFIEKEFLGNSHILTLAIYFSLIGIMHYKLMVKNLTESIFVSFRSMVARSEENTSELQSRENLVCRLLLKKNK